MDQSSVTITPLVFFLLKLQKEWFAFRNEKDDYPEQHYSVKYCRANFKFGTEKMKHVKDIRDITLKYLLLQIITTKISSILPVTVYFLSNFRNFQFPFMTPRKGFLSEKITLFETFPVIITYYM